jgi:GNAT superfamily N-acetyltransferase
VLIEKAEVDDHTRLTELTIQSKSYWGYSDVQMKKWLPDLTIAPDYILTHQVYKLKNDDRVVGYYSYFFEELGEVVLDNLFVTPELIGSGLGRDLMVDFIDRVKIEGCKRILLYSDPNSEGFYQGFGFEVIGEKATSIRGRFLPIMRLEIE